MLVLVMRSLVLSILLISFNVFGHSGRTNSAGCHNDNINGGYHCHNGGSSFNSISSYSSSDSINSSSRTAQSSDYQSAQWTSTKTGNQIVNDDSEMWVLKDSGYIYLVTFLTNKMSNGYGCNERASRGLGCEANISIDSRIFYNQKKHYWNEDLAAIKLNTPLLNAMKRGYSIKVSEGNGTNTISSSLIGFTKAYNGAFGN